VKLPSSRPIIQIHQQSHLNHFLFRGGKPVCCVSNLPGAAFTRPVVTGEVLAVAAVLFLRRLLV
jgi:hypothetical protein